MKNDLIFDEKKLASNIRMARINKGLSQKEIAHVLGVKQQNVGEWETNKRGLTAKYMLMLAKVLGFEILENVVMTEHERNLDALDRGKSREYTFRGERGNITIHSGKEITVYQGVGSLAYLGKCKWSEKREQMLLDGINPVDEQWETIDGEKLEYVDMSSLL